MISVDRREIYRTDDIVRSQKPEVSSDASRRSTCNKNVAIYSAFGALRWFYRKFFTIHARDGLLRVMRAANTCLQTSYETLRSGVLNKRVVATSFRLRAFRLATVIIFHDARNFSKCIYMYAYMRVYT